MASHKSARPVSSLYEKHLRRNRLRKILLESLERRELLASDLALTTFADGTAADYIDQFKQSGSVDAGAPGRWTNPVGGVSPNAGDPAEVSWSIVPDGTLDSAAGETSNLVTFMDAIYGSAPGGVENRPWFGIFQRAFDRWSEVSGISFTYQSTDDAADISNANPGSATERGDIRIGGHDLDGNLNSLAFSYAPSDGGLSGLDGDILFDTNDAWFVVNAEPAASENRLLFNLISQQIGHSLGLGHRIPTNQEKLMELTVTDAFSGPQHDDILGAQQLYGDTNEGNDNDANATDLGALGNGLVRIEGNSLDADSDSDWFKFTIPSSGQLSVTLTPLGEQYDVGDDGGAVSNVDTSRNQDLKFKVFDSSLNQLASVSATGVGASETLTNQNLPAGGTYYLQVEGDGTEPQLYDATVLLRGISTNADSGPTLLSVAPNVGEIFSFNRTNDLFQAPNELTFRFDSFLDAGSLDGFRIVRSGDDSDFTDGDEIEITPGWIGFGDSNRIVQARFSTPLEDDLYRVEVFGVAVPSEGVTPVIGSNGLPLEPRVDGTDRDTTFFRLELGALVRAIVPQPVISNAGGTVTQARDQIVVYFNNDDLHPVAVSTTNTASDPTVVRPEFYQLILTEDSVTPSDDTVFTPDSISYDPATDSATLTFSNDIDLLAGGAGSFRLRIGSNTEVDSAANPPTVIQSTLGADPEGFLSGALDLSSAFNADNELSMVVSEQLVNVQNQLNLDFPGSNWEPGHRDIQDESHLGGFEDDSQRVTQAFYNFALDRPYGINASAQPVFTSITPDQIERVREIYEFYGAQLGIDFVESEDLGMTVVVGDLFPNGALSGPLGTLGVANVDSLNGLAIMDGAENWDNTLSLAGTNGLSFFNTALHEIGHMLGLSHTYGLPTGTIMGNTNALNSGGPLEEIFPGDHDVAHAQHGYRPDNKDVDLYRFDVPAGVRGQVSIETVAERLANSSNADTHLTLLKQTSQGLQVVSTNNDYFSSDSFIRTELDEGTYFIGVTAVGNEDFDPATDNTGSGGVSEGRYDLRINFVPEVQSTIVDINGVALDGDGDGIAGGEFNFWFRAATPEGDANPGEPRTLFVNKDFAGGVQTGSESQPFSSIPAASAAANPGDIIRITASMGADADLNTVSDNPAYEIGRGGVGSAVLSDGIVFEVPQGVTAMVDAGTLFKMGNSRIVVGSRDAGIDHSFAGLQILGTPESQVVFTSIDDESYGIDNNPIPTQPQAGQWGGIEFRNDVDRIQGRGDYERQGIFLNYVGYADMRYGGGQVLVSTPSPTINPIHLTQSRPTLLNNTIRFSSDSAISADPDAFEETLFNEPRYQLAGTFFADYSRVGPEIRGTHLIDNSINGLFIRTETLAGNLIDQLDVAGRLDDTDITHVLGENLIIRGTPGGAFLETTPPDSSLVVFGSTAGSLNPGDTHTYIMTFVDLNGGEGVPSPVTTAAAVGAAGGVVLNNLPATSGDFVSRRIYRSANGGIGPFTLVAEIDGSATSFEDVGEDLGSTMANPFATQIQRARLDARLAIDPGVIIKSSSSRIEVGISAQLIAEGDSQKPVIFTSRADDTYGAAGTFDSNNDGDVSSPTAGDWAGIVARHVSSVSIDSALITYGGGVSPISGGFAGFNALEIHQADARVANSVFTNNASGLGGNLGNGNRDGRGNHDSSVIFVRGSQPVIINNVLRDNSAANTAAISIDANSLKAIPVQDLGRQTGNSERLPGELGNMGPLVSGNQLAFNGLNGMRIRSATLTTEAAWDDTDIVHILQGDIVVPDFHTYGGLRLQSSADESLVVKLGNGASIVADGLPIDIPDRIGGSLQILGTPGFPVVMTSLSDDSVGSGFDPTGLAQVDTNSNGASTGTPGSWDGIRLNPFSNDRNLDTVLELESDAIQAEGINDNPLVSQNLGLLARDIRAGDENLRLGFTIHGTVASPSDLDVYSFEGTAGTAVWFDIDRTDAALDSVVELVDVSGNILAQSDNSLLESQTSTLAFGAGNTLDQGVFAKRNTWFGNTVATDFQTTNPADAGFRIVLPGTVGTPNTYYLRVRSSNVAPGQSATRLQNPSLLREGLTEGSYRLQVRLQQDDEVAGSTIRFTDVRFATNGIEAIGLPGHSPILGNASESNPGPVLTNLGETVNVGNIFESDRAGTSLAGNIESADDIDWYRFSVSKSNFIQGGNPHTSVSFDIDYADGFGRPNTSLWVYRMDPGATANPNDDSFQLVLVGSDSDISDDRARAGQNLGDVDDLSRGSFGTQDPFIGAQELPAGDYVVAVSNNSLIANQLRQFQEANPSAANSDALVRLEPIDSLQRIVEDRFGSGSELAVPAETVAFNYDDLTGLLDTSHAVPWTLADVTTFSVVDEGTQSRLYFTNTYTGATEARVGDTFPQVRSAAMSPDGRLVGISVHVTGQINDTSSGTFLLIDSAGDGATTNIGATGITTFTTELNNGNLVERRRTKNNAQVGDGMIFEDLTFYAEGRGNITSGDLRLFGVAHRGENRIFDRSIVDANNAITGRISNAADPGGVATNYIYRLDPANGSVINPLNVNDRTGPRITSGFGAGTPDVEFFNLRTADFQASVTGLAALPSAQSLVAVSNQGELFVLQLSNEGQTGGGGAVDPLTTLTDGGNPIAFAGLSRAPDNLGLGDIFFGTTSDGVIYAFDATGAFQPVFPGGNFKVTMPGPTVHGFDFSPLDVNLWHATTTRGDDVGHGAPVTYNGSRFNNVRGGTSLYFGFENAANDNTTNRAPGEWDPIHSVYDNSYNLPGGAHGAIESNPIDLRKYTIGDQPTLYFNYYLATQNQNSDLLDNEQMLDAFRVYASGDDGQWILLATNNSETDGDFGNADDEFEPAVTGNVADGKQYLSQEAFDSGDNGAPDSWRQIRAPLSSFAGQENVRLRFEFSTAGTYLSADPATRGQELKAVPGWKIAPNLFADTVFGVQPVGGTEEFFQFDFGLVLDLPAGASITDGDTLTVDGVTFTFSLTNNGPQDILFSADMSPAEIAAAVAAKMAFPTVTNAVRANTLNIDAPVGGIYATSLPGGTIVDRPGVLGGFNPINITQADDAIAVRDAVRAALADALNVTGQENNLDVWPVYGETIRLLNFEVGFSSGALNVANELPGDDFGANTLTQNAQRAQNNAFEGLFVDDIIVGLAERGEQVISAPAVLQSAAPNNSDFLSGNLQYEPEGFATPGFPPQEYQEIEVGKYQLDIRTAADYGAGSPDSSVPNPQFALQRGWNSNDRLVPGIGFDVTQSGSIADGDTFTISDGINNVTFEFNVITSGADPANGVALGNIRVDLDPADTAEQIAGKIVSAINGSTAQALLAVSASRQQNSTRIELHGPAAFTVDGSPILAGVPGLSSVVWGTETIFGEDHGDANRMRDQGVVIIESTFVSNSSGFGINVDAAPRAAGAPAHPGSPINYPTNNPDQLAPGVVLVNNVLDSNASGGIRISGDPFQPDIQGNDVSRPSTIARVVNNTVYGAGNGTGILVNEGAAPAILNNILANNAVGINVAGTASSTVLGANFYFSNGTLVNPASTPEAFRTVSGTDPFIDAANGNFYLAAGSSAIDSSLNSLAEIASLSQLKNSLGLPPSPILAPDRDVIGQRRVDDVNVNSPTGLGSNVFKDRGAYDRADAIGLQAILQRPQDNDSTGFDIDQSSTYVRINQGILNYFEVLLLDPFGGSGPNHATVIGDLVDSDAIVLTENGQRLLPGVDYVFGYNENSRTMRFTPLSGLWRSDSVYEITLNNRVGTRLEAPTGLSVADGDRLLITTGGTTRTFEWDRDGSVQTGSIAVPYQQSYDPVTMAAFLMSALNKAGINAYLQGESSVMIPESTITDSLGNPLGNVIGAISDVAGNALQANRPSTLTQFTIVMPEVRLDYGDAPNPAAVTQANNGARHALLPIDAPHLVLGTFADGDADGTPTTNSLGDDRETSVVASTLPSLAFGSIGQGLLSMPAPSPALNGQIVTITSGLVTLNFEFDTDASVAGTSIAVDISAAATASDVATALVSAVNSKLLDGTIEGVAAFNNGPTVDLGVGPTVDVDLSAAPDIARAFRGNIEIDFSAVAGLVDGQYLDLQDGRGNTVRFELNDTSNPGIFFVPSIVRAAVDVDLNSATLEEVVQAFADAINTRVAAGAIGLGPATANGTSLFINGDDEEGVTFGGLLNAHSLPVPVTVTASGTGILDAWIDWNRDGAFSASERIATNMPVLAGANTFMVSTPITAGVGFTTSRFRLSRTGNAAEGGLAIGGEVEDHLVELVAGFPPTVGDDSYRVNEDQVLTVAGPGVLGNDSDPDSVTFSIRDEDPLAAGVQPFEDVKRGSLVLNSDGSFTYTPEPDFYGIDTFVYFAKDSRLTSGTPATVTIEVSPVNDAPTAVDDSISIFEDQSVVVAGDTLTRNDFKGIFGAYSQTNELPQNLSIVNATIVGPASAMGGSVSVVNNELWFTPPAHYNSEVDGPILVDVTIQDDGQTYNEVAGQLEDDFLTDVSRLTISISELNDSPEYSMTPTLNVTEDAGPQTVNSFITSILPGPVAASDEGTGPGINPENQTVSFIANPLDPSLFASGPSIDAAGTLTYELAPNVNNLAPYPSEILVEVIANDSGAGESILLSQFDFTSVMPGTLNTYDGFTISIVDGNGNTAVFEFEAPDLPGVGSTAGVPHIAVAYDNTDTAASIADKLVAAISNPPAGSVSGGTGSWNVSAFVDSVTGEVRIVGDASTTASVAAPLSLLENLFTSLGSGQSYDGATFTVTDMNGDTITFELNDVTDTAPAVPGVAAGNSAIDYDPSFTQNQLSQAISDAINSPDAAIVAGLAGSWDVTSLLPPGLDTMQLSGVQSVSVAASTAEIVNPLAAFALTMDAPVDYRPASEAVSKTFTILVDPVNDAPEFDLQTPISLLEDAGPQTINSFVTGASAGPGTALDEQSQSLSFSISAMDPSAFASGPTATFNASTGTADLTFELAPDVNNDTQHDLRIIVTLSDNGGSTNGGVDTTIKTLTLDVTPVNDAPSFGILTNQITVDEDNEQVTGNSPTIVAGFATNPTQGPVTAIDETVLAPTMQSLNFVTISVSDPSLFTSGPSITPAGDLEFVTAPDQNGTAEIVVRLLDSGADASTGNGDDNQARPDRTFTISVTAVNDAPTFDIPATTSSREDEGLVQVPNFATNLLPGPATATDELGQQFVVDAVAADPSAFTVQPAIAADGTLIYQTAPNINSLNANLEVVVTVSDDGLATPPPNENTSPPKTFTILVAPVNDAPTFTLNRTVVSVIEDTEDFNGTTETTITDLISNPSAGPASATDEASQNLTFDVVSVSAPELFEVQPQIDPSGQLTFTTAQHKNGDALVVVRLLDDGASLPPPNDNDSILQTFTISIAPINDAPEFTIPSATTVDEDEGLVSINGFATNVRRGPAGTDDENSQQVTFSVTASDPSAFSVQPSISPDGTLVFQTAQDVNSLNANLEVKVVLTDNGFGSPVPNENTSAEQTFNINVIPVNDSPITDVFTTSTQEDQSITVFAADVLVGDLPGPADESTQTLSMTQIERTSANGGTIVPVFSGSEIVSFTYTPPADLVLQDSFLYVVSDNGTPSMSGAGTILINITGVNDPPQFDKGPDQIIPEDAGDVSVANWAKNILAGPPVATDEHGTQTVTFDVTTNNPSLFEVQPAISSDGTLTFRGSADANGVAVVTATPIDDGSSVAPNVNVGVTQTFTITITPVNDEPVFTAGADVNVDEDSGSYSQPWASNIAPAAGLLNSPQTATDESGQRVDFAVTIDQPGLFAVQPSISSSGTLQFTPANDTFGTAVVTVTAIDQGPNGGLNDNTSAPQTLTITINPVNDAPNAVADSFTTDENQVFTAPAPGIVANDTDVDGDPLSAVAASVTSNLGADVVINTDGSFSYDPTNVLSIQQMADGQSVLDTFTYTVQDPAGETSTNVVSITVNGIDDAPVAMDDAFSMGVNQSRLLQVLLNDVDIDTAIDPRSITITQLPSTGSASVNQTGVIAYTAAPGFVGVDTLGYTVRDSAGNLSNEAIVTITINNPPIAVDDSTFTFKNETLNIEVLANDSDPDGTLDVNSIQIVAAPSSGTVQVLGDGTVNYTPGTDFFGEDTFSYVVADTLGTLSNVADVLVRVQRSRWQNPDGNLDVNADGFVSPIDALLIINYLNLGNETFLPDAGFDPAPFLDTNGDEFVSPVDALLVINFLNNNSTGGGAEGEGFDWSQQYAMTITPTQVLDTVGKQVLDDVQAALSETLEEAMQDSGHLSLSDLYGPQLPHSYFAEDDDLVDSLIETEDSDESSLEQALNEIFGDELYGPQKPK